MQLMHCTELTRETAACTRDSLGSIKTSWVHNAHPSQCLGVSANGTAVFLLYYKNSWKGTLPAAKVQLCCNPCKHIILQILPTGHQMFQIS